jgi:small-conductance mechanosensitive channel
MLNKATTLHVLLCLMTCWILLLMPNPVDGQLTTVQPTPAPTPELLSVKEKVTITTLRGILQAIVDVQNQIKETELQLDTAGTEEQKVKLANDINELNTKMAELEQKFETIATGLDLEKFVAKPAKTFNWQEEIQVLLGPIIEELKGLTARPRELEELRGQIVYYERRLILVDAAIANLQTRINQANTRLLKTQLTDLKTKWEETKKDITDQLDFVKYQLEEKQASQQSFVKSMRDFLQEFFKSRGLNLILAVLAFLAVFLLLRYIHRLIYKTFKFDKPGAKRPFYLRLADVIYHIVTSIGAMGAFLLVLYISGDWVLLGIALIFLFGVAWTAKQTIPMFWEQIKLLLNLSTVREGERVIYNGLPWKVLSLNFYTKLHNPALKGGLIRLPIKALLGLQSRPFYKDEPWFPTREGDFVVLSDGGIGTVLMQTPEQVILDILGGCYKTYPTASFLQINPINYTSNSFGVFATFGIDYEHQAIVTREIPEQLKAFLEAELAKEDYGPELLNLVVQFKEAGASSLNMFIFTSWSGTVASHYFAIGRDLQRIAVDACNHYGWVIPFTQVTVHHATSQST